MPEIKSESGTRRGRPPGTSRRQLELAALRLFSQAGYDNTTVEQIAAAAGVSRRSFFRYFDTKSDVLWHDFDTEVQALRAALAEADPELPLMDAIRASVVRVNRYGVDDVPELRTRIRLISTVPALQASSAPHYDAWERAVGDYAAERLGLPPDTLIPLAVGRCTLAAARAAFDEWVSRADHDLTVYLDRAVAALARGFAPAPAAPRRGRAGAARRATTR